MQYQMDPKQYPVIANRVGEDLIVTDGNTLLGGDDKAGIAMIMPAVDQLIQENLPHGDVYVAFTPDEEVGRGTETFDLNNSRLILPTRLMGVESMPLIMKTLMPLRL